MIAHKSKAYFVVSCALAFGSFIVFCNLYLLQPVLPKLMQHFHVSEVTINWVFAATSLALSCSLVPWALLSERVGRRPVMLTGLLLTPLSTVIILFSQSIEALIVARALVGLSLSAFAGVAVAYMAEEFDPHAFRSAIGAYIAANSLGGIIGRLYGGFVSDSFGWQTAYYLLSVLTILVALFVWKVLPKQQHFKTQRLSLFDNIQNIKRHLTNYSLWFAMLVGGVNFAIFVNVYSVMTFRLSLEPYSLSTSVTSMIFICYLAGTFSSSLTGKWKKYSPTTGMLVGASISFLGVLCTLGEPLYLLALGLLLISFGSFFLHTLAYGWVSTNATHAKATATSLYLVHYYIGGSLGGFLLLSLWQHWAWNGVVGGACALYVLLSVLILSLVKRKEPQSKALA
ncbi:MFS transporter [Vibrio maerlii]|uniref:MFS transporter n=1 Tax=Vibrio maerlii TaxID=2231648 RepID=UPI000E3BE5E0|nr:MFS transporter [Vibrio maerlii]